MNLTRVSKKLSFLLRHSREPLLIDLNGGWAWVEELVAELRKDYPGFNGELLAQIVAEDQKTRYSYDRSGRRLRANQGHSIPGVVIDMEEPEPPELLYHGTGAKSVDAILREGLRPMRRLFVHISPDIQTARAVGSRHGKPVILTVQARRFVADGHPLKRSANGVWQAEYVPPEYLSVLTMPEE